ncbi:hypothetical protein M434DRAFT_401775 [Hypoxylon sp. CO27-5]|nr:hypothetical protein M434DRAFT_401775 [Hypoxylon sp. CO27-5]
MTEAISNCFFFLLLLLSGFPLAVESEKAWHGKSMTRAWRVTKTERERGGGV